MKMKKGFLLIFSLLSIGLCNSQVGVNILNPQGVFHIDPKGNTGATGANFSDDIIVNSNGNMGIGTLAPQTKLHIASSDGTPFIRIQDPSEEVSDGKFLVSNATGAGSWAPKPQLSGKVYRMTSPTQQVVIYKPGIDSPVLFNKVKLDNGSLIDNANNGYIKIDADGNYIFTLRWFGSVTYPAVAVQDLKGVFFDELLAVVKIRKVVGGVVQLENIDQTLVAINKGRPYETARYSFTVSFFVPNMKKGETYTVIVNPSSRIGKEWEVAKGLNPVTGQFDNITYFPSLTLYNI